MMMNSFSRRSRRVLPILGFAVLLAFGAVALLAVRGGTSLASVAVGASAHSEDEHDHTQEEGHVDEEAHADEEGFAADEGHADEEGHTDDEEEALRLSAEERERFGIRLETARAGRISTERTFPGETRLNEDRMAHIVPRAPGIVRSVAVTVGDQVEAGTVMAWVESAELGSAKVDYLSKWAELGCCQIDLARAEEVHVNTTHFLEVLRSGPSLETLRKANGRAMGAHRSRLVAAYADYVFAREAHQRERSLFDQEIGSREDLQATERALKRADANYSAAMDEAAFEVERTLLEAKSTRSVQEIELLGAERLLHLLGLSKEEIEALPQVVSTDTPPGPAAEADCADPNCEDCQLGHGAGKRPDPDVADRLGWYPLQAPFDGMVIERHITLGENIGQDDSVFTVANLDTVWVDVNVYQRDLDSVRPGRELTLSRGNGATSAAGTVQFVSPLIDEATRTALARVLLPNEDGAWRPGLYVEARLDLAQDTQAAVVPKDAVQQMGSGDVVFVETPDGFTPESVVTGGEDGERIEILAGLLPGQTYVASGAFALKAHLATSNLSGHAGHGH